MNQTHRLPFERSSLRAPRGHVRPRGVAILALGALFVLGLSPAWSSAGSAPSVGEPAPPFDLVGTDGKTHALSDYAGKRGVVLAWFPKAFTPG